MRGLFITGTDTGAGKTVATATLCRILRSRGIDAVAFKPFATGIGPDTRWKDNDPLILAAAMDYAEPPEVIAPLRLKPPLSPYDAARVSHASFDIDAIIQATEAVATRHELALVEGVGGVCVPLTEDVLVADFAKRLGLPALVVARSSLGTINHSLLTVTALRSAGVSVEGLIFSRPGSGELSLDEIVGPETACRFARTAFYGLIQHSSELDFAGSVDEFVSALPVNDQALIAVADSLLTGTT